MRRIIAAIVLGLFLMQSSGATAVAARVHDAGLTPLRTELATLVQPVLSTIEGSQIVALLTGNGGRYAAMHAPAPKIPRIIVDGAHPTRRDGLIAKGMMTMPRQGIALDLTARLPRNPGADRRAGAVPIPLPLRKPAIVGNRVFRRGQALLAQAAVLTPSTTGINPWWSYEEKPLAGVGKAMTNVANGNLIIQADDVDVPGRGIDLAFRRTYNAQSMHDASNTDGSTQALFGNGWTNTFDAHIAYNAASNVMSVYDIDGARYDYTAACGNAYDPQCWTPPAGMQGTSLFEGASGLWWWTKKNGTQYGFFPFDAATKSGWGPQYAAYAGRIQSIYGRNWHNNILFQYHWTNGDATSISNLTQIVAQHADGQALTLNFAPAAGTGPVELSHIVRPDGTTVDYSYDSNGNLLTVARPGHGSGPLIEGYWYWGTSHAIRWVAGPRYMAASPNNSGNGSTDGSDYEFLFDANTTSGRLTQISDQGLMDFAPADGTATSLQGGSITPNSAFWRTTTFAWTNSALTQVSDTQGHATNWTYDAGGRVTQTQSYTGSQWLVTDATWDTNLNKITKFFAENVDSHTGSPAETDYAYDANGNTTSVTLPWANTSLGWVRPTSTYTYDAAHQYGGVTSNNILAYCDANYNWPAVKTCSAATGATYYTYDYSDSQEPFGRLTDAYTPLGYHTHIDYNTSIGDVGLPSDVTAQSFAQSDGTTATPQQTFTYDAYGNLTSYSKGYGSYTLAYDSMNRMTAVTDPDNVTDRTCYNADGTVSAKQSALQYSLDGTVCGSHSVTFTYDADGDVTTENHHYGGTLGTTQKWYDGEDRLVEVSLPPGDTTDYEGHGLTRYLYDLTQSGVQSFTGASSTYSAHGGLYKTQACYATGPIVCPNWTDLKGQAFDNLDRLVTRYQHIPGQSTIAQYASTYDNDPTTYGLLSYSTDAMNVRTTHAYDATGKETQVSFSDTVTPGRNYTYDPDGRPTQITSTVYGGVTYTYDQDGRLTSKQETAGSGMNSPALITYGYYPNGWRSSLSVSSQALTQQNLFQYAYRNDGKRTWLLPAYKNNNLPFRWAYTNAGRATSQSDPLTGGTVTQNPTTTATGTTLDTQFTGALQPLKWQYDLGSAANTGELTGVVMPMGNAYSAIAHDPEGNVTTTTISGSPYAGSTYTGLSVGNLYDPRGQLTTVAQGANGGPPDYSNTQNGLIQSDTYIAGYGCQWSCNTAAVDFPTGAALTAHSYSATTSKMSYDADGRAYSKTTSKYVKNILQTTVTSTTFDSENHTASQIIDSSDNGAGGGYGWGPEGHPVTFSNPGVTLHWDGDDLLFVTFNSTGTPQLTFLGIEKLGFWQAASGSLITAVQLWITDRDYADQTVQEHNATTSMSWEYATPRTVTSPYAPKGYGTPYSQGGFMIDMARSDGYQIGDTMFQGVRAFDPESGQWTTPDAYQGEVHDPMSQRSYMWNDNNPISYSDPSGYEGSCYGCQGMNQPAVVSRNPNSDFALKVEGTAGVGLFGVSASISVTSAPAVFVSGGLSGGFGKPAMSLGKVGLGGSVALGIVTAKNDHTTSGVMSQGSTGGAAGWVVGAEHTHNADGQFNAVLLTTPQIGAVGSYGIQLWGGAGASPKSPKKPQHAKPRHR